MEQLQREIKKGKSLCNVNQQTLQDTKVKVKYKEPEKVKKVNFEPVQKQEPKYSIYKSERWKEEKK